VVALFIIRAYINAYSVALLLSSVLVLGPRNGASSDGDVSVLLLLSVLGLVLCYFASVHLNRKKRKNATENERIFSDFLNRMNVKGFKDRVILYDFLPKNDSSLVAYWSIGCWLDYQERQVALVADEIEIKRSFWDGKITFVKNEPFDAGVVYVPFNYIQKVEIIAKSHFRSSGGGLSVGGTVRVGTGGGTTRESYDRVQVRLVTAPPNGRTQNYTINIYDKNDNGLFYDGRDINKCIECAKTIEEEMTNIIQKNNQTV
jgi:hypothetical protein